MSEKPGFEKELLIQELEMESIDDEISEDDFFKMLSSQIGHYLDTGRLEYLLNLMYRHDVKEEYIRAALDPSNPVMPQDTIARLLMDRLRQKMITRQQYTTPPVKDWLKF